jgi:glutamine amidotransferase
MRVAIADYGAGNVRSLCAALERAGTHPEVTSDRRRVRDAPLTVVAGVGHLASAAQGLEEAGVADALRERTAAARPVLGVCVGMQLLFEESEEGGSGLGLLRGAVRRLRARRVPHMGWNDLRLCGESSILDGLDGADFYFAHSYACDPVDPVTVARTDHDGLFAAAVEAGSVAGVQFHPERSGAAGASLLRNVVAWSRSV